MLFIRADVEEEQLRLGIEKLGMADDPDLQIMEAENVIKMM